MEATALKIIQTMTAETGLTIPVSIEGATDPGTLQLKTLLTSAGYELLFSYQWQFLDKTYNLVGDSAITDGAYPLPTDWAYFIDQTQWDVTDHWPLLGPKSPQEWKTLTSGLIATFPYTRYRVWQSKLWFWPPPGDGVQFSMEYMSNSWVWDKGVAGVGKSVIDFDADVPLFDWQLLTKYLKLKYLTAKGLNTVGAQGEFLNMFYTLTGKDVGAPVLSLANTPNQGLLGPWSVPDGSWNVYPSP